MKYYAILFIAFATLCVVTAFKLKKSLNNGSRIDNGQGTVLIELFTSEGCSSCPTADKLVAKIADEFKGNEVYVLTYHVDYWDRLGWKDPYSSHEYTKRQSDYVHYLKLDGAYTPQAVVNGRTEFVGSDERRMRTAVESGLAKAQPAILKFTNIKINNGKATANYETDSAGINNNLLMAVVKKHAVTQVKAGENDGRILPHINIVEKLQAMRIKSTTGNVTIVLPAGFNVDDHTIIGFIQNDRNGSVLISTSVKLN